MSIALVVTRGFGNGTLAGDVNDVVTRGYTIGEAAAVSDYYTSKLTEGMTRGFTVPFRRTISE